MEIKFGRPTPSTRCCLRRWIPTYISYTCKAIAVIIAYHVQKIITAFYSATRGGLMVFRSLFAILDRRGIVHVDHNETCDRCPRCRRVIENSPAGTWTKSWVGR